MARVVGNNDVGAVLQQVDKISNVFARGAMLFDFLVVHNGSNGAPGAKCDIYG